MRSNGWMFWGVKSLEKLSDRLTKRSDFQWPDISLTKTETPWM